MILRKLSSTLAPWLYRFPWLIAIPYRIWAFFQAKHTVGAVGVIFNPNGQVLLVKHVFHPKYPWGLPGGWVGFKENPSETVRREIEEEIGLNVIPTIILLVDTPHARHLDIAYLCEPSSNLEIKQLSFELIDYGWFEVTDLPCLLRFHYEAIQKAVGMRSNI
ncbi:MAG: NUDIX hydrolase [Chloroflexi bacterium]|nr:MAG: NUDIX hydrolase [Chloroflexota bacterium]